MPHDRHRRLGSARFDSQRIVTLFHYFGLGMAIAGVLAVLGLVVLQARDSLFRH
jgi:hypothetical protein